VSTFYTPHNHNLAFLRTQAERLDMRLVYPTIAPRWQMHALVDEARRRAAAIQQSPSLQMTVAAIARDVQVAAEAMRVEDRHMLDAARAVIDRSVGAIDTVVRRGEAPDKQEDRLIWAACGGLVTGILLWSILPGAIARCGHHGMYRSGWQNARLDVRS